MERITVRRRGPLEGTVVVPGAKNSVLKLMAATILAEGTHRLTNVPDIIDVGIMAELLAALGVRTEFVAPGELALSHRGPLTPHAPAELVEQIRASIVVLGPLLARFGQATISLPGGDDFGSRPIDMHLRGLEAMGASFRFEGGDVIGRSDGLRGAIIALPYPSVGATENVVMAAVLARGTTVLSNAAREPEISDLCLMLNEMGAEIRGIDSGTLTIEGVEPSALRPADHAVVTDRIQAATYLAAVGVSTGEVILRGPLSAHMEMLLDRFAEMGMEISSQPDGLVAVMNGRLRSVDAATLPYPGVATDYKPLIVTMLSVADGVGIVTENLYPGRFRYVEELHRLGADIRTDGHHAVIRGKAHLCGAPVRAPDIRAGAALVIAGLAASGETVIGDIHHIDRGYDDLVGRLRGVGADITRDQ